MVTREGKTVTSHYYGTNSTFRRKTYKMTRMNGKFKAFGDSVITCGSEASKTDKYYDN